MKLLLSSPQSLYSAVDDLRGTKADREQLEIEVKEVYTYAHIVTVSIHAIACIHLACILACELQSSMHTACTWQLLVTCHSPMKSG